MKQEDKQLLQNYLNSERLMAIATQGEHLWAATVYYVSDDDLNLYFISPPNSEHIEHIQQNNNIACAIADSHQSAAKPKVGLQLFGIASEETDLERVKWMLKMYNKLHPTTKEKLNFENFQSKVMTSRVYKVSPTKIKFFNQELFGDEEEKTYEL